MNSESPILIERSGHIATITIAVDKYNFLDAQVMQLLLDAFNELHEDRECRAMVLTSKGDCFSAGANFNDSQGEIDINVVKQFYASAAQLFNVDIPIVAAIRGPAIGAGLGIAMVADFRYACPEARFSANFTQLGFHPGFALDFTLPRVIGRQSATRLLLTGERVSGEEAYTLGLIDKLVPQDQVVDAATNFAEQIASSAPLATRSLIRTLKSGLYQDIVKTLEHDLFEQEKHFRTKDFLEGIAAMRERRLPIFKGE